MKIHSYNDFTLLENGVIGSFSGAISCCIRPSRIIKLVGSTSQATNVIEALETESSLLLVDEDTSATNFMIRDGRMQQLIFLKLRLHLWLEMYYHLRFL
jgi:ABC-type Fe3+/spermidine/putrescine transport system ATPase subunit